ncbi:hypothetical protein GCM10010462_18980 [Microbacterium dextranolyticum]|uniref:DUF218 domain-containing protein n=2 Tax=Microbacterium dextranolyticum TaxID=36806 RepID=A0A9W6M5S9_9MICO|nr:hypothetical protein GCM10017591_12080 [Microbacterium dextranolyticum]
MPGRRRAAASALAVVAGLGCALLVWGEVQAANVARADYPDTDMRLEGPPDGRDVVLVLGFRSRTDGRRNAVQVWRTRIAVRSAPRSHASSAGTLFVFSGGAVRGSVPEADLMARYAVAHLGVAAADVAIERHATSTRENLTLSLPWLSGARTIRIASNTAHARRARRYLRELDPELWRRLRRTRDFMPLELGPLRLALTFYDFVAGRKAARDDADASRDAVR